VTPFAELILKLEGGGTMDTASTRAGLVVLGAFLASFLFIRTSARLMRSPKVPWWPGSVKTEGGLHVHHLVFGIAAFFGIGAGLTLDEYALWLHLDDVYWAEEGRRSVDAVVILLPVLSLVGAIRLAKPDSPWARRRYPSGSRKLARAADRHERHTRRYQSFQDRIAGSPAEGAQ
jgi:hypothetical protein